PCESCGGSITGRRRDLSVTLVTYAVVPPSIRGQSRLALPGNQEPLLPRGIGSVGVEGVSWDRTAVVLGARESRVHGEGRECWQGTFAQTLGTRPMNNVEQERAHLAKLAAAEPDKRFRRMYRLVCQPGWLDRALYLIRT